MKVSEKWLREWVDPPLSSEQIAEKLTLAGLEVDALLPAGPPLPEVVVAEVLAVERHPDAERLSLCTVNDGGTEPSRVVCGAPNVRTGMKAAWARPGAELPNDVRVGEAVAGSKTSAEELELLVRTLRGQNR